MNRIIRWYNKNRKIFLLAILVIIALSVLPRVLNEFAKSKKEVSSSINNTTTYNNEDYSIITGETVEEETSKENSNIINSFIDFCNNGNIENAYQILSKDCKDKLYPTINDFKDKYYNKIFNNKKSYSIQAWVTEGSYYTYKIDFKEDMLSTGNANSASIEDYYTIVYEDGGYKLNINNYIASTIINKINETDELKIAVLSKDVFMEYEIYNIYITSKIRKIYIIR